MKSALHKNLANFFQQFFERKPSLKRKVILNSLRGKHLFNEFNTFRMKNALNSFSGEMLNAFYDILFFLHNNHVKYSQYRKAVSVSNNRSARHTKQLIEMDLHVEDCPFGIVNVEHLDPLIQTGFKNYVKANFEETIIPAPEPIFNSVASLGSIGTIAHKKNKSDLDLQVQYDFSPFYLDNYRMATPKIVENLKDIATHIALAKGEKNLEAAEKTYFSQVLRKKFRFLYHYIENELGQDKIENTSFAINLMKDIQLYFDLAENTIWKSSIMEREKKVQEKIKKIQHYLDLVYPSEEIYLFAYTTKNYRKGKHGSTLDSKESSGSAYELILNYETLMPGIQFTPQIPAHFLFGEKFNRDPNLYLLLMNSIRLTSLDDVFGKMNIVDLGPTMKLDTEYMSNHFGAVYWEAFKGSSGNLPKAFLNLQRLEMLLFEDFQVSVIDMIKDPEYFKKKMHAHFLFQDDDEFGLNIDETDGLSLNEVMILENRFTRIKFDPWWLRFKSLKIWLKVNPMNFDTEKKKELSRTIDICFALHVWIIDVIDVIQVRVNYRQYREVLLKNFYDMAFPPISPKREFIEKIFIGEVETVNEFESKLNQLFNETVQRMLNYNEVRDAMQQAEPKEEHRIWMHYYDTYFIPKFARVHQSILSHLKHARGRLQILYNGSVWVFRSINEIDRRGKRFDTFGTLKYEPEKVDLYRNSSLFEGIVHCIFNGYYGVSGGNNVLKKSNTVIEFNTKDFGYKSLQDQKFAALRSENLQQLASKICSAFPIINVNYKDCLTKEFVIRDVIFCFNILHFGSVNILYRDMMGKLYVKTHNNLLLRKNLNTYTDDPAKFRQSPEIFKEIKNFLVDLSKKKKLNIAGEHERFKRLHIWLNPASVEQNVSRWEKIADDVSDSIKQNFIDEIASGTH